MFLAMKSNITESDDAGEVKESNIFVIYSHHFVLVFSVKVERKKMNNKPCSHLTAEFSVCMVEGILYLG